MTTRNRNENFDHDAIEALDDCALDAVTGGMLSFQAEAQVFQVLTSALSEVMKDIGAAMNTAARRAG
jgi:hypothetical protein